MVASVEEERYRVLVAIAALLVFIGILMIGIGFMVEEILEILREMKP